MAVNGTTQTVTPATKKRLAGPTVSTPFDLYDRLFASFDEGKVFSYGDGDARQLRQMLRQDGNARKIELVLTLPLRSAAWEIRKAPGGDAEYKYVREQLDAKLGKVIDQLSTAVVYRKAFFELTYGLAGSDVTLEAIDFRPPATCEAAYDAKTGVQRGFRQRIGNPGGLITIQANQTQSGDSPGYVTIEPERAFVFVHGSYSEPIEGISDLDVAYWCWETRQKIYFLWFQFLEQQSLPKIVAYGDDPTQADRNADAIAEAKASGVIGIQRPNDPAAKAFDIVASDGAGAGQFLEAIRYLEGQMSASVLAGFTDLTSLANGARSGTGSYALSADQSEFFLQARQAVADEIAEAVSTQLFAPLVAYQFGADAKPPTLTIGPLSKRDKDRSLGMLNSLLTAPHFNAPPQLIDLLIKSSAGYLGLPVDMVAQMVDDHPTQAPVGPGGAPAPGADVPPTDEPAAPAGQGEDDPAMAKLKELAGLAHSVDAFAERTAAGEDPRLVVAELTGRAPVKRKRTRRRRT